MHLMHGAKSNAEVRLLALPIRIRNNVLSPCPNYAPGTRSQPPHFRRKWESIIRRQSMRGIRARIRCVPGLCDPTTRLGSRQPPELSELSAVMVAHRAGFEPTTPRFVVWCSIQLSYRCCSGPPKLVRPAEIGKHQDWDGTKLAFHACRQAHSPPSAVGAVQDGWAALA